MDKPIERKRPRCPRCLDGTVENDSTGADNECGTCRGLGYLTPERERAENERTRRSVFTPERSRPETATGADLERIAAQVGLYRHAFYGYHETDTELRTRLVGSLRRHAFTGEPLPSPRIYVAGASKEPARVRAAMGAVVLLGWTLTLDWLAVIESVGAANEGLTDKQRRHHAREDLAAVDSAHVVWVLAPEGPSTGAWCELQRAIDLREFRPERSPSLIVSGPGRARCIFASLADLETDSDLDALAHISRLSRGR
jgi:ribosomal protein S27AE